MAIKIELLVDDKGTATVKNFTNTTKNEFKKVQDEVNKTNSSFSSLKNIVAGVFGGTALTAIAEKVINIMRNLTIGTLEYADSLQESAAAIGVNVEALQELRYAFQLNGVSADRLDQALIRFTSNLGKFGKQDEELTNILKQFGVTLRDDATKALDKVFVGLANVSSQSERSALAAQIFGREAGPRLASVLGEGIGGLNKLREEARSLGIVMGDETVQKLAKLKDAWDSFKEVIGAEGRKAIVVVYEAFEWWRDKIIKVAEALGFVNKKLEELKSIGWEKDFIEKVVGKDASAGLKAAADRIAEIEGKMAEIRDRVRILAESEKSTPGLLTNVPETIKEINKEYQKLNKDLQKARELFDKINQARYEGKFKEGMTSEFDKAWEKTNKLAEEGARASVIALNSLGTSLGDITEKTRDQIKVEEERRKLNESMTLDIISNTQGEIASKLKAIEFEYQERQRRGADIVLLEKWKANEILKIQKQLQKAILDATPDYAAMEYPTQKEMDKMKQDAESFAKEKSAFMKKFNIEYAKFTGDENTVLKLEAEAWYEEMLALHEKYNLDKTRLDEMYREKMREANSELYRNLKEIGKLFKDQLTDALTELIMGTKTAKEAFRDLLEYIAREFLRRGIMKLIDLILKKIDDVVSGMMGAVGGGGGGGFNWAATIAGTAAAANSMGWLGMQHGGPVSAYKPYMVGEAGPELFMPRTSGSIVPNDQLGRGGGRDIIINSPITINNNGGSGQTDPKEVERTSRIYKKMLKDSVKEVIMEEQRPMGLLNR